jgi:RimJ/RimL family protein N-acetyltransferase
MQTKSLKLVLQALEEARAEVEAMSPADRAHVSAAWLARLGAFTSADPWTLGFFLVHRDSETLVGSAGFKGPPEAERVVEIAYGIHPDHRGKGYATEAA